MICGVLVNGQFGLCKCKGMCVSCLWSFMTFGPHASELKCKKMECGIQDFPLESHLMATSLRPFNFDELGKHVIMWIIRFVGAHNLEVGWICTECNPYWYDWYCYQCRFSNWFLHWTPTGHYGQCGENCGCCRFREDAFLGPCGECLDLYAMSMTSCAMRGLIHHYDGL